MVNIKPVQLGKTTRMSFSKINEVLDNDTLCGCLACKSINNTRDIKDLYSKKNISDEYYYYARQIMNSHSIWQHCKLTELVSQFNTLEELIESYPLDFFKYIYDNIN